MKMTVRLMFAPSKYNEQVKDSPSAKRMFVSYFDYGGTLYLEINELLLDLHKRRCMKDFISISGTICVMSTFPFLFMVCLGCSNPAPWAQFFYYVPFVVIFQFGWASTQISHLSLIPELTVNANERVELNALRSVIFI